MTTSPAVFGIWENGDDSPYSAISRVAAACDCALAGAATSLAGLTWNQLGGTQMSSAVSYELTPFTAWIADGKVLTCAVALLGTDPDATLANLVAGAYDIQISAFANWLNANGFDRPNVWLRLGWEMNQQSFPGTFADDPTHWIPAWQRWWRLIKATCPNLLIVWNPVAGWQQGVNADGTLAFYPGADYVDRHGVDLYDVDWSSPGYPESGPILNSTVVGNVGSLLNGSYGLGWHASFATENGKPFDVYESGIRSQGANRGAGDDAYFITELAAACETHSVEFWYYFDAADSRVTPPTPSGVSPYPLSLAALRVAFSTLAPISPPPPVVTLAQARSAAATLTVGVTAASLALTTLQQSTERPPQVIKALAYLERATGDLSHLTTITTYLEEQQS